jgi:hypothetical protein
VMAVCLLAALGLVLVNQMVAALVCGLCAAATAVVALVQNLLKSPRARPDGLEGPLGSGPHTRRDCAPNPQSVGVLNQMAQQLREAAKDEHWTLDWARFNAHGDSAQAAVAARDYTRAVREYALAISFMMSEIRRQPARKGHRGNSVLDM